MAAATATYPSVSKMSNHLSRPWLGSLLLLAAALLAFGNTLDNPFVFDDVSAIVEHPGLQDMGWQEVFRQQRGLVYWTFALDWRRGGGDPRPFHVTNLLIHLAAAVVLWRLVRRTLLHFCGGYFQLWEAELISLAAALIWLVHPLQTESVTFIVQRLESMMGLWTLLGLWMLSRGLRRRHAALWLVASLGCLICGARTKEAMVVMPVLYAWYDAVFSGKGYHGLVQRRWYYLAVAVSWSALYWPLVERVAGDLDWLVGSPQPAATQAREAEIPRDNALGVVTGMTPWRYARSQPQAVWQYLQLTVWPARLCIDYVREPSDRWTDFGPPLLVSGLTLALWCWSAWRWPRVGILGGAFLLLLALRSSILPRSDIVVEHRMYLPLAPLAIGFALALTVSCRSLPALVQRRSATLLVSAFALLCLALGSRTFHRNRDYASSLRLWTQTVEVAPHNPRALTNLGLAQLQAGQIEQSILSFQSALRQESVLQFDQYALFNLGNAQAQLSRYAEAANAYAQALELVPQWPEAHNNLAFAYLQLGKPELAAAHCRAALSFVPDYAGAHLNLSLASHQLRETSAAVKHAVDAVTLDPRSALAHRQLGRLRAEQSDFSAARESLQTALRLDGEQLATHELLADVERALQNYDAAAEHRQRVVRARPDDPRAAIEWALDLAASGKNALARKVLNQTLARSPDSLEARLSLGDVHAVADDWAGALRHYEAACEQFPHDFRPYVKWARAAEARRDWPAAESAIDKAFHLAPDQPAVMQLHRRIHGREK